MAWKDDNFWKQVKSFKGCGQDGDDRLAPEHNILLWLLIALATGLWFS